MTIEEDLIYFLKNGKLKNINFAITEKQLAEILGETNSIFKHKYADLYQYGFFEFLMWKDDNTEKLKCITINRPNLNSRNEKLHFNLHNWTTELSIEKAIEFLKENEIEFEETEYPLGNDYRILTTKSKVNIGFMDWNENGNFTLLKLVREIELSSVNPPTKQISFEVKEIYYDQLREEAKKTRISIANQCREIIENYLKSKS